MTPDKIWAKYSEILLERLRFDPSFTDGAKGPPTSLPKEFSDPNKSNKYTEWVVVSYINKGILRYEDIQSRVYPALKSYEILSRQGKLSKGVAGQPWTDETNILNFCGLVGCTVKNRVKHGLDELIDRLQPEAHVEESLSGAIYDGEELKIYQPRTVAESCHYGKGTKWCTAATKGENLFDYYNAQSPLYVIVPKNPLYVGEKYQMHFATAQFMNEKDVQISPFKLVQRFPELLVAIHTKPLVYGLLPTPEDSVYFYKYKLKDIVDDGNIYYLMINGYFYAESNFDDKFDDPEEGIISLLEDLSKLRRLIYEDKSISLYGILPFPKRSAQIVVAKDTKAIYYLNYEQDSYIARETDDQERLSLENILDKYPTIMENIYSDKQIKVYQQRFLQNLKFHVVIEADKRYVFKYHYDIGHSVDELLYIINTYPVYLTLFPVEYDSPRVTVRRIEYIICIVQKQPLVKPKILLIWNNQIKNTDAQITINDVLKVYPELNKIAGLEMTDDKAGAA